LVWQAAVDRFVTALLDTLLDKDFGMNYSDMVDTLKMERHNPNLEYTTAEAYYIYSDKL
jgi:hypothetical protein